ncbi:MAG: FAD binding domain-containing protein [Terriglobales bacterium]
MRAFEYLRAADVAQAVAAVTTHRNAAYLAGGTTQLDLMKDGVLEPDQLVDITRLPLRGIALHDGALRIGALVTMEELADDRTVRERMPVVREPLLLSAPCSSATSQCRAQNGGPEVTHQTHLR